MITELAAENERIVKINLKLREMLSVAETALFEIISTPCSEYSSDIGDMRAVISGRENALKGIAKDAVVKIKNIKEKK